MSGWRPEARTGGVCVQFIGLIDADSFTSILLPPSFSPPSSSQKQGKCSSNASPWWLTCNQHGHFFYIVQGTSKLFPQGGLWEYLKRIMKLEGDVSDTVKDMPLALGGLGLRSATRTSESPYLRPQRH